MCYTTVLMLSFKKTKWTICGDCLMGGGSDYDSREGLIRAMNMAIPSPPDAVVCCGRWQTRWLHVVLYRRQ